MGVEIEHNLRDIVLTIQKTVEQRSSANSRWRELQLLHVTRNSILHDQV